MWAMIVVGPHYVLSCAANSAIASEGLDSSHMIGFGFDDEWLS